MSLFLSLSLHKFNKINKHAAPIVTNSPNCVSCWQTSHMSLLHQRSRGGLAEPSS